VPAIFRDDDEAYVLWRDAHPRGFVLNTNRRSSIDYAFLHRASCRTITDLAPGFENWTRDYIKICAEEKGEILVWCYSELGGSPESCQICSPMSPA
jgi:hypothetical protein